MLEARARELEQQAKSLERAARQARRLARDVEIQAVAAQIKEIAHANDFDLLQGALLLAKLEEKDLDVQFYTELVDRMADDVRKELEDASDETTRLAAMNKYLFSESGYHGSRFE